LWAGFWRPTSFCIKLASTADGMTVRNLGAVSVALTFGGEPRTGCYVLSRIVGAVTQSTLIDAAAKLFGLVHGSVIGIIRGGIGKWGDFCGSAVSSTWRWRSAPSHTVGVVSGADQQDRLVRESRRRAFSDPHPDRGPCSLRIPVLRTHYPGTGSCAANERSCRSPDRWAPVAGPGSPSSCRNSGRRGENEVNTNRRSV
jgi:hypothetical protein